ncbi:histone-fold-containing protein [Aureobasidium pullulans]|uniref:Histone-fold-containing protein n=1 Tax=Aureobasidium pullulans TaxID=5580 RepID=A0A4S9D113_AURPU|nr:histone-fold-containing protein [Aureobasidium pullulans]
MPYNNTPITPSSEITGTVSLPLARVKKIIHADDDIANCSNNAAFAITAATELFLQYLVEQTQNVVKAEKKPRRNIQYKDVASAVARVDNLEFLADVVPKTVTYKEHKARKQRDEKEAGQKTLPTVATTATATAVLPADAVIPAQSDPVPAPVQAQLLDPMDETS